jgi:ABC-type branched-subunit amino acid transport system substrate-binding protein
MAGRDLVRVGVLLPFSARAQESDQMLQGVELAMFNFANDNTILIPRDAGASASDAENAARALAKDGADVIIGPLQREGVVAANRAVRNSGAPVIAFSTDRAAAGDGAYLLSFPLEEEVARVVDYASKRSIRTFAILAPDTEYGRRVDQAFKAEVASRQGVVALSRLYPRNERDAKTAAIAFAAEARAAGVQAIMLPDRGSMLRATAPGLIEGGLDLKRVRLLGTGEWNNSDVLREPTLAGGWFAGPAPNARTDFENRFRAAYGAAPSRAAGHAYDAMALAAYLTRDNGRTGLNRRNIERQDGFTGADGLFRFRGDGTIERALAVLEVRTTGPVVIEAAPQRFNASGS